MCSARAADGERKRDVVDHCELVSCCRESAEDLPETLNP